MPDLNLNCDYFDHRKTKRLVGLLGRGAEVIPIKLWSYCGKFHADTGRLAGYSEQEIEALAGWWGKAGEMLPSLERAEFMHKEGNDWVMTGWLEHQGHIASFKRRGRENALKRWGNHASSITNSNAARNAPTVLTVPTSSTLSPPRDGEPDEHVVNGVVAEWPSESEWMLACRAVELPDWRAKDEWLKQESARPKWAKIGDWRPHVRRVLHWWEKDGRPLNPPTNQRPPQRNQQPAKPAPKVLNVKTE